MEAGPESSASGAARVAHPADLTSKGASPFANQWIGILLALGLPTLFIALLYWPLLAGLDSLVQRNPFSATQVWCFDQIARMLLGLADFSALTARAGYPYWMDARFMAWVPAILVIPIHLILGPLAAFNLAVLFAPGWSALGAWLLLRKLTGAGSVTAGLASVLYGLQPFLLSTLANGQIEKAQLWAYPLYLWVLLEAIGGRRSGWALAGVVPVTAALVFTDPYFGLFLPLVAAPLALGWGLAAPRSLQDGGEVPSALPASPPAPQEGEPKQTAGGSERTASRSPGRVRSRRSALARAGLALALTAAVLLSARAYYEPSAPRSPVSMFRTSGPPPRLEGRVNQYPAPSATPGDLLTGPTLRQEISNSAHHVSFVGIPALLLVMLALVFRPRGWRSGLLLLVVGVVVAMGPRLLIGETYQMWQGHPYYLPAELLERLGYPLSRGGQYYRAVPLAWLGIALLLGGASARLRPSWGVPLLACAVLGLVGHAFAATAEALGPVFQEIPGQNVLSSLDMDVDNGAVLALPLQGDTLIQGMHLVQATLHGRATSAVARQVRHQESGYLEWLAEWRDARARGGDAARTLLSRLGFRYVVVTVAGLEQRDPLGLDVPTLRELLGAPMHDGVIKLWDLGPTELQRLAVRPPVQER